MMTIISIALVAGAASGLMFASIVSGALTSLLLFYLAPLPLMVAALGWGPICAGIGGLAAAIGLGAIFGLPYCLAFVLTVALPACWLGHLALLGRPVPAPAGAMDASVPPAMEWYPVGRILLWTVGFAALTTMAALLTLGGDAATITTALRRGLLRIMGVRDPASPSGDAEHFADALVAMAPAGAALVAMMTLTLNLWLAAKITATSGRLHRPWPDLKSAALPPLTLATLSLALGLCFVGGLAAMLAQIISAALVLAYGLIGFAVLHTLTLSMKSRPIWLGGTYAMVLMIGWPILAMVGLGLADAVFGFRQRYLQRRTPPARPDLSA